MTSRVHTGLSLSQSELDVLLCLAIDPIKPNTSRVMELLEIGACPDVLHNRSQSALYLMAGSYHPDSLLILNALISHGADPNSCGRLSSKARPLHAIATSSAHNQHALAKMSALVLAGADPNAPDSQRCSPAWHLCQVVMPQEFDALHALRLRHLVSLGADIATRPNPMEISFFETAAIRPGQRSLNIELLRELVSLGAHWDGDILQQCAERAQHYARFDEFALFARSLQDQRALEDSTPRSSPEPAFRL